MRLVDQSGRAPRFLGSDVLPSAVMARTSLLEDEPEAAAVIIALGQSDVDQVSCRTVLPLPLLLPCSLHAAEMDDAGWLTSAGTVAAVPPWLCPRCGPLLSLPIPACTHRVAALP